MKVGWEIKQRTIASKNTSIVDVLKNLKQVELTIAGIDKYVEYCIRKYKHFQFNIKLFMKDQLIEQTTYVESLYIDNG